MEVNEEEYNKLEDNVDKDDKSASVVFSVERFDKIEFKSVIEPNGFDDDICNKEAALTEGF